jgi:hypothetical protein
MPVHKIISDTSGVLLHVDANKFVFIPYSSLSGVTREEQGDEIVSRLQGFMDGRQKRNTLPQDDPDRSVDPAQPWLFWEGTGGQTELVSREILVIGASWIDATSSFSIGLRRNR